MNCPNCRTELFCHCAHCIKRNFDKTPFLFKTENVKFLDGRGYEDVELEYCGACGYTDSTDGWFDIEVEQVLAAEGVSSLTELVAKKNGVPLQAAV